MSDVTVLGRDAIGVVAESEGMRYYLTECCGASAKGMEGYIGCRSCYAEIDPQLGDVPDQRMVQVDGRWTFVPKPMHLLAVYGDGIPYDEWKKRRCHPKEDGGWHCKPAGNLCTHPGGCLLGPDGVGRG